MALVEGKIFGFAGREKEKKNRETQSLVYVRDFDYQTKIGSMYEWVKIYGESNKLPSLESLKMSAGFIRAEPLDVFRMPKRIFEVINKLEGIMENIQRAKHKTMRAGLRDIKLSFGIHSYIFQFRVVIGCKSWQINTYRLLSHHRLTVDAERRTGSE
jgi:hypothetical protein